MSDTIELLELIGQNASLRHAPAEELSVVLEQAHASKTLAAAAASGDRTWLSQEFGSNTNVPPQVSQAPGYEEEEGLEEDAEEEPLLPPAPNQDNPVRQR